MMSSVPLKVLLLGNNPNIQFYSSRFASSKNIELYHVNDSKSSVFTIDTNEYNEEKVQLDNHFTSTSHLVEALEQINPAGTKIFDFIITSASSLQELSSLPSQLKSVISEKTAIFVESSGFVRLETFLRSESIFHSHKIFSILTDYDIRATGQNTFKQFDSNEKNTIYIGHKSSSRKAITSTSRYSNAIVETLETFETLLSDLFPFTIISHCDYSPLDFLSHQWNMAIPKICLDPLLIIFEENDPSKLSNQILAKPLISGIITEIITVAKSMHVKLNDTMDNEDHILKSWTSTYNKSNNNIPSLLYHFINLTSNLEIDLLLLQPILLADDHDIKTPYLEFLYTTICQFVRLNEGKSAWFSRSDNVSKLNNQISDMKKNSEKFSIELAEKDNKINGLKSKESSLLSRIDQLENELSQWKSSFSSKDADQQETIRQLREQISSMNMTSAQPRSPLRINQSNDHSADAILAGSSLPAASLAENQEIDNLDSSDENDMNDTYADASDIDRSMDQREKEIQKKESELKEREMEFKKQLEQLKQHHPLQQPIQPQQPSQPQQPIQPLQNTYPQQSIHSQQLAQPHHFVQQQQLGQPHLPHVSSNPSIPELGQLQTAMKPVKPNKAYSTPTNPISASSFVDPISNGMSSPISPFDSHELHTRSSFGSHPIKTSNRKNRSSHLPNIGHASNINLSAISTQAPVNARRISSLPTHAQMRTQPVVSPLDMPHPIKLQNQSEIDHGLYKVDERKASNASLGHVGIVPKMTSETKPIQFNNNVTAPAPITTTPTVGSPKIPLSPPVPSTTSAPIQFNSAPTSSTNLSSDDSPAVLSDLTDPEVDTEDSTGKSKKRFGLFKRNKKK